MIPLLIPYPLGLLAGRAGSSSSSERAPRNLFRCLKLNFVNLKSECNVLLHVKDILLYI